MTTERSVPSGRQIELEWQDQRAIVTEVGGGLRCYTAAGRAVMDGFEADEMCRGGRGQVLAPWPNRLSEGRYHFDGEDHQLPLDEPELGNAIHGLVRWANWEVLEQATDRVVVGHLRHPRPGYPFTLELAVEYRLAADGLTVATRARNAGERPLPFGLGFHPYLTVGTDIVDQATLCVPGGSRLEADARGIPSGTDVPVEGSALDFRSPRPVGDLRLDTCFGDLRRSPNGRARVVLAAPGGSPAVTLWMDRSFAYVMVFTGDTLAPPRRRRGLAVEPMTCPPNAFRSGLGLQILAPGAAAGAAWGIEPRER